MENTDKDSRLRTTDENGNRIYLYPEDIEGKWKSRRRFFSYFLIFLYLILPWIYIDNRQWILLDISKREFYIFGNLFYGHDGPLLIFLVFGFIILMAFITSIWGRVWCGWACPQTVFIDTIFRQIEKLVEGNARARKKLHEQKWTVDKIAKRSLKWLLFLFASLHIVHSFLGYFVGTHNLFYITLQAPSENWGLFITMLAMTGIILFDFGWFREQFCIIACPYGRFQSVAMDEDSMIVAYDATRGEPRRSRERPRETEGDCINCNHCVKACPTGIDIRNGTQMECISCTMCIDACDSIMAKLKREPGLISYTSETKLKGAKSKKIKPRSFLYLFMLSVIVMGLVYSLNHRKEIKAQFLRGNDKSSYQEVSRQDGSAEIVNHFKLKLYQAGGHTEKILLSVSKEIGDIKVIMPFETISFKEDQFKTSVFFYFSPEILNNGSRKIKVSLVNSQSGEVLTTKEINLVGPIR